MITITGSKYALATLASVNTIYAMINEAVFVQLDFKKPRRVDLWAADGTTYKGSAFARIAWSTSNLMLETPFFDLRTGVVATQVIGDVVRVSLNYDDIAQAGIVVVARDVTISDQLMWGTDSVLNSLTFHDESKTITNNVDLADGDVLDRHAGGICTLGHLQDYATGTVYGGCDLVYTTLRNCSTQVAGSTSGALFMYGGAFRCGGGNPSYTGSGWTGGAVGTDWWFWLMLKVELINADVLSKNAGGNWDVGSNHVFDTCTFVSDATFSILVRWANGIVRGGSFKVPNGSSAITSIFGSDATGTFALGAPAGKRSIVLDNGTNIPLWRASGPQTQVINIKNLITVDLRMITDSGANPNASNTFSFEDNYTNVHDTSIAASIRASNGTIDSSTTAVSDGSVLPLTVLYSTGVGIVQTAQLGPWISRIRHYSYEAYEQAVAESNYDLGAAGVAKNVVFGGRLDVAAITGLVARATVDAYTGISIVDHGASPVTWNGKAWSITITADLSVNPTLTAAKIYAYARSQIAKLATWDGKAGPLWHDLLVNPGQYESQRGNSFGAGAALKGVRIIDQTGAAFLGFQRMQADDASYYNAAYTLTVNAPNLPYGSTVGLYNLVTNPPTQLDRIASTSGGYSKTLIAGIDFANGDTIELRAIKVSGVTAKLEYSQQTVGTTSANATFTVTTALVDCPVYNALAIDGSLVTGFAADYINLDVDITLTSNFYLGELYAWWKFNLTTAEGMRRFWGGISTIDVGNYQINSSVVNIVLDNLTATDVWALDNRRLFRTDGARPVKFPTTGTGGIDVEWREKVLIATVGGSALTTAESNKLMSLINPDNSSITSIKSKTDNLPTSPAAISDIRGQLTTELARIDVAISSRNAIAPSTPTNITDAVTSIKGGSNKDLTQVFNNTPAIDPSSVWGYATRTLTAGTKDSQIDAIKAKTDNLPTSPVAVSDIPTVVAIRTEIDANSSKLDAAISTRLATSSYVAPDNTNIVAIAAKLPTAGAKIAGEGATAKNLDQVSVDLTPVAKITDITNAVASIKGGSNKDLTQVFNNTPSIDPSSVWGYATRTLTAGTKDSQIDAIKAKTDNLPTSPAAISDIRGQLTTELARIDVAISSRMATAAFIPSTVLAVTGETTMSIENIDTIVESDLLDTTITLVELGS